MYQVIMTVELEYRGESIELTRGAVLPMPPFEGMTIDTSHDTDDFVVETVTVQLSLDAPDPFWQRQMEIRVECWGEDLSGYHRPVALSQVIDRVKHDGFDLRWDDDNGWLTAEEAAEIRRYCDERKAAKAAPMN